MVYLPEKDIICVLCGFIQYEGFVLEIVSLEIKRDEELYRKNRYNKSKDFGLFCKVKKINLGDHSIDGRIFASVSVVFNHIVIFGGIKDETILNDMHFINMNDVNNPIINRVDVDSRLIVPRFGMSGIIYMDGIKQDISRLIIFGGSTEDGTKLIQSMTNEVIIFQIKVK